MTNYVSAMFKDRRRLASSLVLAAAVLLAAWMGSTNGGFFIGDRGPVAFVLAVLMLVMSVTGVIGRAQSFWSVTATSLLTGYTAWTFVSLLWSPNRGDAWFGATTTLFYLLAFWIALAFVTLGASRRWALAASSIGPALVAAFTLSNLAPNIEGLFPGRPPDRKRRLLQRRSGILARALLGERLSGRVPASQPR